MKRSTAIVVVVTAAIAALALRAVDSRTPDEPIAAPVAAASFEQTTTTAAAPTRVVPPDDLHAVMPTGPSTLVVYTGSGQYGYVGEGEAIMTANLLGGFGPSVTIRADRYPAGLAADHDQVAVVVSNPSEQLPVSLLDDLHSGRSDIIWLGPGVDQLLTRHPSFSAEQQIAAEAPYLASPTAIRYKGVELPLPIEATEITANISSAGPNAAVVADAVFADGSTRPWAIKTPRMLVLGDAPFSFHDQNMSYLVLADQLQQLMNPGTQVRHRAMIRLEDVGPAEDPDNLRAIADVLAQRGIPFSVATYPVWRDPAEVWEYGPELRLSDAPEVIDALEYVEARNGTLILHGYTHQRGSGPNPYDGTSGADYEFFSAHVDENDYVVEDGPLPRELIDSTPLRIRDAMTEMVAAGFEVPTVFEFPHYAAAEDDYRVIAPMFEARFERSLYFLQDTEAPPDSTWLNQWYPYPVVDSYGELVLPENLGNVEPEPFNQHPAVLPAEIVENARLQMVVDDHVAAFFYHPFFGPEMLAEVLDGMLALGYEFVDVDTLIGEWHQN